MAAAVVGLGLRARACRRTPGATGLHATTDETKQPVWPSEGSLAAAAVGFWGGGVTGGGARDVCSRDSGVPPSARAKSTGATRPKSPERGGGFSARNWTEIFLRQRNVTRAFFKKDKTKTPNARYSVRSTVQRVFADSTTVGVPGRVENYRFATGAVSTGQDTALDEKNKRWPSILVPKTLRLRGHSITAKGTT